MQQRRHAAHQRSGCRAVPPEAQKGGCATSANQVNQVAGGTNKKKPRPLGEVLQEFKDKVIKAAQKLKIPKLEIPKVKILKLKIPKP